MPINGAQGRSRCEPFTITPPTASSVTSAARGAAAAGEPAGASSSIPNTMGMIVTGISISTTPETDGVKTRRNAESLNEKANWNSAETSMRDARRAMPPCWSASTLIAMAVLVVPVMSTYPAPKRPRGKPCSAVMRPQMTSDAKTPQMSSASGASAARKITIGMRIVPLSDSIAYCRPRPAANAGGGFSCGS